jgi:hypothetical protein
MRKLQLLKVMIGSVNENGAVRNLCLMTLSGFERYFTFQVNIARSE